MSTFTTIQKAFNKSGKVYVIGQKEGKETYQLYTKKTNYMQGRDVTRWVACHPTNSTHLQTQVGYTIEVITSLFNKKLKGSTKP